MLQLGTPQAAKNGLWVTVVVWQGGGLLPPTLVPRDVEFP